MIKSWTINLRLLLHSFQWQHATQWPKLNYLVGTSACAQTRAKSVLLEEALEIYARVRLNECYRSLQNGLSIIDSPGVGESEEMTNLVKSYIPKAFGFIYVINCANAGGVQPDRV